MPTDFSKNALNAARYALDLFRHEPCIFYLLNVYQVDGYSIDTMMMVPEPGERAYEAAKKRSETGLEKFMEMLRLHGENPKHQFETIATFNSLVYGIKHLIAEKDIEMIVMGTRGATDANSIIFGTNTIHVMEQVQDCPVLAIPSDFRYTPPREIVFPTDYKAAFKRRELKYLLEIVAAHSGVLHILHIEQEPELSREQQGNKELLQSILEETPHEFHTLSDLKLHQGIGAFVASRKSDLIAFMNRKHSFLGKILSKPLVKELGYHYQIPILELNT